MKTLHSPLKTAEVARQAGYSVQQIRNLERDGVLPAASRSPTGYRMYRAAAVQAAAAYRAFAAAVGPVEAKRIMRAVHATASEALELVDEAHAGIHAERRELRLAQHAVAAIAGEPVADVRPSDSMTISELARALGIRPSTLRHWETEGLITAGRSSGRVRSYTPRDVRDVRIVHQLRLAGYRILALQALMPLLRGGRDWQDLSGMLAARDAELTRRSRELLAAAAALHPVLTSTDQSGLSRQRPS